MDGPVLLLERIDWTLATTRFFFLGGGDPYLWRAPLAWPRSVPFEFPEGNKYFFRPRPRAAYASPKRHTVTQSPARSERDRYIQGGSSEFRRRWLTPPFYCVLSESSVYCAYVGRTDDCRNPTTL